MESKLNRADLDVSNIINHMKDYRPNLYKNLIPNNLYIHKIIYSLVVLVVVL